MKKMVLLLALVLSGQLLVAQNKETAIDWKRDLDTLAKVLPEKHCNLFTIHNQEYFQNEINRLKAASEEVSSLEMMLKIQQLVASMGDSHTTVNIYPYLSQNRLLPMGLRCFEDKYYIMTSGRAYGQWLGTEVTRINDFPISVITDSLKTLITVDNQACVRNIVPNLIPYADLLEYFGFVTGDEVKIGGLKEDQEVSFPMAIQPINRGMLSVLRPDSVALCDQNRHQIFSDIYLPESKTYYIPYNACTNREWEEAQGNPHAENFPSFEEFEERFFKTLKNEKVQKIVFDLRYNTGGNSKFLTKLGYKLLKSKKKIRRIPVYAISGPATFSSAIINLIDLKVLAKATIVGEETAGKPNHFGEIRGFTLPSSGLQVSYSTKYFERFGLGMKDMKTIVPDVKIERSFDDFMNGIDPVMEWIQKQ